MRNKSQPYYYSSDKLGLIVYDYISMIERREPKDGILLWLLFFSTISLHPATKTCDYGRGDISRL
jgi:hypothetical protein